MKNNLAGCDSLNNLIHIVSVVGPTASGKTKLSVELAKNFNGEIISADSMQIYKDMQIATAKPTEDEKCGIAHHLMDFLPTSQSYSVANFVSDAKKCIKEICEKNKLPIIVGGTGLYVDSLLNNIAFSKDKRDEKLCNELMQIYKDEGAEKLLEILNEFDCESAQRLSNQVNVKRIIRAIEFYKTNGITITEHNKNSTLVKSPYKPTKIGINFRDRQKLYDRINKRVDIMIEQGLLEEARKVISSELSFTSVKAIGYKELIPYFNNEKSLDECIEKLKMETRRYAKRQITWFKRDKDINWIYADDYGSFEELYETAALITKRGM